MHKSKLQNLKNRHNLKILLHVGTPKTATTTIQHLLHNSRAFLLENGYCYPFSNANPPKHQWMVSNLMEDDINAFIENFEVALSQTDQKTERLILSTEGIFNHWNDFSQTSKSFLHLLGEIFDVEILLVLRDQISFTKSYYKQILKNPQVLNIPSYGVDISLAELLEDRWFVKHLDYSSFVESCQSTFPSSKIKIFLYKKDIIEQILNYLHLDIKIEDVKSENISLSTISCELLRVVNRYNLEAEDKQEIVSYLSKMDKIMAKYEREDLLDAATKEHIKSISLESNSKLELDFFQNK